MFRKLSAGAILVLTCFLLLYVTEAQRAPRLARPTNLKFSGESVTWNAAANAHRYHIRWRVGNASWQHARISRLRTSYRFTRLPLNVAIRIEVRALAGAGGDYRHSLWSDPLPLRLAQD